MRLNIYKHSFWATCPVDAARIKYHLQIESEHKIIAEQIEQECLFSEPAFHEDIADKMLTKFSGRQTLAAVHGSVAIETIRGTL